MRVEDKGVYIGGGLMFNKFWNFQKILSASSQFDKSKKIGSLDILYYIIFFSMLGTFSLIFNGFTTIIYFIGISLALTYRTINSDNKIYESIPVSRGYTYMNIVLIPYIVMLSCCLLMTISVVLINYIIKSWMDISLFNLIIGSIISPLLFNWMGILLVVCISILIINILMPIFFINRGTLRKILIKSILGIMTIVIVITEKILPIYSGKGEIGLLNGIFTNYNDSLLILFSVCVIIIPISNYLSYKLYVGRGGIKL